MLSRLDARVNLLGLGTVAALLGLWELAVFSGLLDYQYLPPPSEVTGGLAEILATGELQTNLLHTLTAALVGWALALVVGVPLGIVLGLVRPAWAYSMASFEALRALPIVAFVPVAVLLLGFTIEMEVVVACYASLWPILINTIAGIKSADSRTIEVGEVLRLRPLDQVWRLRLPAATSHIVVGARLGLAIALVLTLVAEMVGNPAGLGYALVQKGAALQAEQMFAYVVVIGLCGIVLNAGLVGAARVLFPGQMAAAGDTQ